MKLALKGKFGLLAVNLWENMMRKCSETVSEWFKDNQMKWRITIATGTAAFLSFLLLLH